METQHHAATGGINTGGGVGAFASLLGEIGMNELTASASVTPEAIPD